MRIGVTGASGFVGGWVARVLAARGHEVHSYGRRPPSELRHPLPRYRAWDIVAGPIKVQAMDAVVHCAARVDHWGPYPDFYAANVLGTRAVLETLGAAPRFVHISSASVRHARTSAYGVTKAQAEAEVVARRPDAAILRPFAVYGPGDSALVPRLLAARRFGCLAIPGDGRVRFAVTHVQNLAEAAACAVECDAAGVFDIADDNDATLDEALGTLFERLGVPTRIIHVPRFAAWALAAVAEAAFRLARARRPPVLTRYVVERLAAESVANIGPARSELGYVPRWTLRDGPLRQGAC